MGKRSNFRTTVTSCLLSVLVALSGAISPAHADVPAPTEIQTAIPATFGAGVQNAIRDDYFRSVSCSSAGNCVAAGRFYSATGYYEAFTQTQTGGIWATAVPATFGANVQNINTSARFNSVSCSAAGNCVAVGRFYSSTRNDEAFTQTQTGGIWATAVPATFGANVQNASRDDYFSSVSCSAAGNCVAAGQFANTAGNYEAFTQTQTGGIWATAIPATFGAGVQSASADAVFNSVSCSAAGNCVAAGQFKNTAGKYEAFTQSITEAIEVPADVPAPANGQYVCTTGEPRASGDTSPAYTITAGVVSDGARCAGALVIAPGVTEIGRQAFSDATALSSVTIPSSVTNMQFGAFARATALTSITFAPGSQLTYLGSDSLKYTSITSITIPAGVTIIESNTFEGATKLTSINFAQGSQVTRFGNLSFKGATSLSSITIPAGVISIENNAFQDSTALTSINFAQGSQLTTFGNDVFRSATSLTSITIPAGVTRIGNDVFRGATALKSIYFKGNAPTLDFNSFGTIVSGVKAYVGATATGFGTESTWYGLVIARAPEDASYVCTTGEFASGDSIPTYTITAGVVTDGASCAGAVVFPANITEIGEGAFDGATGLTSISIPDSVTTIGWYAFYGVKGTSSISIPASVTSIGVYAICETAVTSITVDSANPNYASQGGVLFNKDLTTLIAYPSGNAATSYVVPLSVTTIDDSSFYKSMFLKSITIPNSVTSILAYAFASSPNLETVAYASDSPITDIAPETFYGLPKLRSIELPPNLESIGSRALESLPLLTTITIPASVNTIGESAFLGNSSLVGVYFLGDAPAAVSSGAFGSGAPSATAYILPGATGYALDSDQKWNGLNVAVLYNVSYNSAGGTAVASGLFTQGGSIQTAPVSTRAGYTLAGWSATDGGNVVTFPYSPNASGDITLYAKWTQKTTPVTTPATPTKTAISSYAAKFPAGSSVMTKAGKTAILKIVNKAGKDAKFTVTGVAAKSIGVPNSNVKTLAKARAEKVQNYLIKLGVKKSNITIKIKIIDSGITPKTKILAKYLT